MSKRLPLLAAGTRVRPTTSLECRPRLREVRRAFPILPGRTRHPGRGRLAAFQEGPDLLKGANLRGAKCNDHPPMISSPRTPGSSPAGNLLPFRLMCRWTRLLLALTLASP